MTKAPVGLQELRRRIYRKAKSDKTSDGGDGVTNTSTKCSGCIGTGNSTPCRVRSVSRESGPLVSNALKMSLNVGLRSPLN